MNIWLIIFSKNRNLALCACLFLFDWRPFKFFFDIPVSHINIFWVTVLENKKYIISVIVCNKLNQYYLSLISNIFCVVFLKSNKKYLRYWQRFPLCVAGQWHWLWTAHVPPFSHCGWHSTAYKKWITFSFYFNSLNLSSISCGEVYDNFLFILLLKNAQFLHIKIKQNLNNNAFKFTNHTKWFHIQASTHVILISYQWLSSDVVETENLIKNIFYLKHW